MHIQPSVLVVAGSVALTIALGLAWLLAGLRYLKSGLLKSLFRNHQHLLSSHLDYVLMTGLLMIFFLLFAHFRVSPPAGILLAMCFGSLVTPFGFFVLAMKPDLRQHPSTPFGAIMAASFVLTTIGYVGAAWFVARAAILGG